MYIYYNYYYYFFFWNIIDLRPLKLWPVLLDVFTSTTEPEIKMYIAWIFGTSVQNNDTAQKDVINNSK